MTSLKMCTMMIFATLMLFSWEKAQAETELPAFFHEIKISSAHPHKGSEGTIIHIEGEHLNTISHIFFLAEGEGFPQGTILHQTHQSLDVEVPHLKFGGSKSVLLFGYAFNHFLAPQFYLGDIKFHYEKHSQ